MSKGKIDISSAVDNALIKARIKTQALLNGVTLELQKLEIDGVTIEDSFVKAIAKHIKDSGLTSFSVTDLDKVMESEGVARPKSAQGTVRGLRQVIEGKLAAHFYDVSERYGASYQDLGNGKYIYPLVAAFSTEKKAEAWKDFNLAKWLKGENLEAAGVAKAALTDFLNFDPKDPSTFPGADKLKVETKQKIANRTESFAQASMAVDAMITEEM